MKPHELRTRACEEFTGHPTRLVDAAIRLAEEHAAGETRRVDALAKELLYQTMAGCWLCPQCQYQRQKTVLTPNGAFANTEPFPERCPNDGVYMQPMTYRQGYDFLYAVCEMQIARAVQAEALLDAHGITRA